MNYKPEGFSELSVRNGMKKWIEDRRDRCNDPLIYDELPREIKEELNLWIAINIVRGKRDCLKRSSYGLKADFQRETGIYVYTGAFAGAMMKAGYQPMNPNDINGRFFKIKAK